MTTIENNLTSRIPEVISALDPQKPTIIWTGNSAPTLKKHEHFYQEHEKLSKEIAALETKKKSQQAEQQHEVNELLQHKKSKLDALIHNKEHKQWGAHEDSFVTSLVELCTEIKKANFTLESLVFNDTSALHRYNRHWEPRLSQLDPAGIANQKAQEYFGTSWQEIYQLKNDSSEALNDISKIFQTSKKGVDHLLNDRALEETAEKIFRFFGDSQQETHQSNIKERTQWLPSEGVNVYFPPWKDWRNTEEATKYINSVNTCYETDANFQEVINKILEKKQNNVDQFIQQTDFPLSDHHESIKYILEKAARVWFLTKKIQKFLKASGKEVDHLLNEWALEEAAEKAFQLFGKTWEEAHQSKIIEKTQQLQSEGVNVHFSRWKDWYNTEEAKNCIEQVEEYYKIDPDFQEVVKKATRERINKIIIAGKSSNNQLIDQIDRERLSHDDSIKYILEEAARVRGLTQAFPGYNIILTYPSWRLPEAVDYLLKSYNQLIDLQNLPDAFPKKTSIIYLGYTFIKQKRKNKQQKEEHPTVDLIPLKSNNSYEQKLAKFEEMLTRSTAEATRLAIQDLIPIIQQEIRDAVEKPEAGTSIKTPHQNRRRGNTTAGRLETSTSTKMIQHALIESATNVDEKALLELIQNGQWKDQPDTPEEHSLIGSSYGDATEYTTPLTPISPYLPQDSSNQFEFPRQEAKENGRGTRLLKAFRVNSPRLSNFFRKKSDTSQFDHTNVSSESFKKHPNRLKKWEPSSPESKSWSEGLPFLRRP